MTPDTSGTPFLVAGPLRAWRIWRRIVSADGVVFYYSIYNSWPWTPGETQRVAGVGARLMTPDEWHLFDRHRRTHEFAGTRYYLKDFQCRYLQCSGGTAEKYSCQYDDSIENLIGLRLISSPDTLLVPGFFALKKQEDARRAWREHLETAFTSAHPSFPRSPRPIRWVLDAATVVSVPVLVGCVELTGRVYEYSYGYRAAEATLPVETVQEFERDLYNHKEPPQ